MNWPRRRKRARPWNWKIGHLILMQLSIFSVKFKISSCRVSFDFPSSQHRFIGDQADHKRWPPPFTVSFCDFIFGVLLTLYYDYMCSETDFTQEKVNFHATIGIPNSTSYCCCPPDDHLQEAGPSLWQPRKGHKKCIFETPHNEIKCVLSVKEKRSKF